MTRSQKLATFNIDPELWKSFKEICQSSGSNASEVLVNFVRETVTNGLPAPAPSTAIDPAGVEKIVGDYLERNLDRYLEKYLDRSALATTTPAIDGEGGERSGTAIGSQESGDESRESEPLPIIEYLAANAHAEPPAPEPPAPESESISVVDAVPPPTAYGFSQHGFVICKLIENKLESFWTGGGWSFRPHHAKVYQKEGTAKTQIVRVQREHPGVTIKYNFTQTIESILSRTTAA